MAKNVVGVMMYINQKIKQAFKTNKKTAVRL